MTTDDIVAVQSRLGLSDGKMATALGVTRQTWRNWRRGCTCPLAMQRYLTVMLELRRLDPANDNLPKQLRFTP